VEADVPAQMLDPVAPHLLLSLGLSETCLLSLVSQDLSENQTVQGWPSLNEKIFSTHHPSGSFSFKINTRATSATAGNSVENT